MIDNNVTVMMKRSNDMKKVTKKNVYAVVNGDEPFVTAPHLDKLSAVVNTKDKALHGLAYNTALTWLETCELGMGKASGSVKYPLALKVHYPVTGDMVHLKCPHLLLQFTSKKASVPQVRLEWNPTYITEDSELYLDPIFIELFGMTFYEFLFHARFTRADFCRNILWRELDDYLRAVGEAFAVLLRGGWQAPVHHVRQVRQQPDHRL